MSEADIEVEVKHAREPHKERLGEYYHAKAGKEEIEDTIIFIRNAENGPIPQSIEEKKHHGERIVDAAAIITFWFHFLTADFALVFKCQAFAERKDTFIDKHRTHAAAGALHAEQRGD